MLFVADRRYYRKFRREGLAGLKKLSALNRINALTCIKGAEHGWLGASYSVAELLTVLYFGMGERNIVLSKGHAAALQYACLYGAGLLQREHLLTYKDGPSGLQAHPDVGTPGILINTGSLGQGMSKVSGLAWARRHERFYVVVGDGELQEGQNFEALQTISHFGLSNLTIILDRNGYQSDLEVDAVKRVPGYRSLFEGFGLDVVDADGHDPAALFTALTRPVRRPRVLIARTEKAGGSRFLRPVRGQQPWHSAVPDGALYRNILSEQVTLADHPGLKREFEQFCASSPEPRPVAGKPYGSTRDWFVDELAHLAARHKEIIVLDADLAKACGISGFASSPGRFLEMGISEQDMVSFAGGLALAGRLPIVNTYAAFFKRAYDQLCVNLGERRKIIYAGHYAGLCYHTDGKTHQSLNDLSLMRAVPGLTVIEPVDERQTRFFLRWAVEQAPGSVYFRLRRTAAGIRLGARPSLRRPAVIGHGFRKAFLTSGTVATAVALAARAEPEFADFGLVVQCVYNAPLDMSYYRRLLGGIDDIVVLEDNVEAGGLYEFAAGLALRLGVRPTLRGLSIQETGWSFRTLGECLAHFGFTTSALKKLQPLRASELRTKRCS
jgi:transketolase